MPYNQVLGELKNRRNKFITGKGRDEIADIITILSVETTPGVVNGIVRPATKLAKCSKVFMLSDCR
jgi:hypothetical protein